MDHTPIVIRSFIGLNLILGFLPSYLLFSSSRFFRAMMRPHRPFSFITVSSLYRFSLSSDYNYSFLSSQSLFYTRFRGFRPGPLPTALKCPTSIFTAVWCFSSQFCLVHLNLSRSRTPWNMLWRGSWWRLRKLLSCSNGHHEKHGRELIVVESCGKRI